MNDDQLAAIEARVAAAKPGPWEAEHERDGSFILYHAPPRPYHTTGLYTLVKRGGFAKGVSRDDVELIAHAREDIPALIAEVRRLRAAYQELGAASDLVVTRGRAVSDLIRAHLDECPLTEGPTPPGGAEASPVAAASDDL